MKKAPSVALVGGGRVSQSFVARLPFPAGQLGPVKALSYRVASRISNALRAGQPVRDYLPLGACRTILICVPEIQLRATLAGLAAASIVWSGKSVVLCGSWRGSEALDVFAQRGASCASLNPIEDGSGNGFLAEGAPPALQRIRELIGGSHHRILEIAPEAKPLVLAGLTLAGETLVPLLAASAESLRAAGLSTAQALAILRSAVDHTARAYAKAGRKAWNAKLPPDRREALGRQLDALLKTDAALERFFLHVSVAALELFRKDAAWLADRGNNYVAAKAGSVRG
jgi:predicted short-subunit dehydrogenase-like oxidoreductase (DUF2520 family)